MALGALLFEDHPDQRTLVHDPLVGQSVGEFRVTEVIGVGGMGVVYKGVHPLIGKTVAMKVLRPEAADDPEQVKRLLDEARALTAVHHRGIVDVFSFGTLSDGRPYLVMEYLQGQSLQSRLEAEGRIGLPLAIDVFDDVLSGLSAAHKVGLVHRDLKPSNIFLAREAEGTVAKIVDFGIAKQGRPGTMTPQTVMYRCIGTPEFVSPEQACGYPVGPQSDLYSFGICAFFALTGKLPFEGEVDTEVLMK
ncbi:MAG: serine/threonine protein kinase, partial [Myxococcaceae bacterium]